MDVYETVIACDLGRHFPGLADEAGVLVSNNDHEKAHFP